jgi:hypothetical protein
MGIEARSGWVSGRSLAAMMGTSGRRQRFDEMVAARYEQGQAIGQPATAWSGTRPSGGDAWSPAGQGR